MEFILGHATAIGRQTGKCVGYGVRAKACRKSRIARKKKTVPKKHKCVHNWDGSSKAMESDIVVGIVKDAVTHGVQVKRITGDD